VTAQIRAGEEVSPTGAAPARRPSELFTILAYDRRRRLEPNADTTALVDIGALGGNAPDDIFGGQYRCHQPPP
jgi:hypothetical protein